MATTKKKSTLIGKVVLVRDHRAGVLVGKLVSFDPATKTAHLKDARKVWYWSGAAAVEGIATRGLSHEKSKVSPVVASSVCMDVVQLIECATAGAEAVMTAPEWKP